mmetsp:Transcript_25585/g.32594  ORF Transcript_25585/g.32594 Transcript_25585/m.32594 type:complete len:179 (-) Transcript_25585:1577-2113(-)
MIITEWHRLPGKLVHKRQQNPWRFIAMYLYVQPTYINARHSTSCFAVGRCAGFSARQANTRFNCGPNSSCKPSGIQMLGGCGEENVIISYNNMPKDQTSNMLIKREQENHHLLSTFSVYAWLPILISGAISPGVPTNVLAAEILVSHIFATPKSQSFTAATFPALSFATNTLPVFISR